MIKAIITICFLCLSSQSYGFEWAEDTNNEPPVLLSLEEALILAIKNNPSLKIQKIVPELNQQLEIIQDALFDPEFSSSTQVSTESKLSSDQDRSAKDFNAALGVSKRTFSGGAMRVDVSVNREESIGVNNDNQDFTDSIDTEFTFNQPLLEGRGSKISRVHVQKARLNTAYSKHQVRRFIETLLFNTSNRYWDYYLEKEKLKVFQESYQLALKHQQDVEAFIENGKVAEIELAIVQAEVSSRKERLIKAQGLIYKSKLQLIHFIHNYSPLSEDWMQNILPITDPAKIYSKLERVQNYLEVAIQKRPEIQQAQIDIEKSELEWMETKNGLLPKLDFFISLGNTQYSNSFVSDGQTHNSKQSVQLGLNYRFPVSQHADKARHRRSELIKEREIYALDNLYKTIGQDVRMAYIDCQTNLESIKTGAITKKLRIKSLKNQEIKFELGNATNTDIANSQRDLLQSQINYTTAIISYIKSRNKLHYLDSTLVERTRIQVN